MGVPQSAEKREIRKAFMGLSLLVYPDHNMGYKEPFDATFKIVISNISPEMTGAKHSEIAAARSQVEEDRVVPEPGLVPHETGFSTRASRGTETWSREISRNSKFYLYKHGTGSGGDEVPFMDVEDRQKFAIGSVYR
ncbi:uncharacterized protein L3040_004478 [Drepanopeziza brunnea f. sp. 'multigermtubi']|uniref:Uncharacterized protein n=1 Tax=Marssonina brunnea f. sp. multigermtubi (strain MB_m1) TaxID=1072389 RepID=K1WZ74_MARBU|nr:uncharacterized protein MBM_03709 [Drepanopeziza brunnea f. sp. 'multigermtubi' MB_m1]EKD17937.1 hypothetical protein MBM_03709 [Drepanopeziza brunnea f. sp. 'multigermtubi' MB_m1]KAJ5043092.1 hypothetical protein L3040_004478 [Drepanopeziza brunnea f. sp. 'multigermtubi']